MDCIDAKSIFQLALNQGSVSDLEEWTEATGKVLFKATIDFIKPKFKVSLDRFTKDPYVNSHLFLQKKLYTYTGKLLG